MCYSCGCGRPYDDHGDESNITEKSFEKAGRAIGKKKKEVKKNTLELLQEEVYVDELKKPQAKYTT